MQLGFGRTTSGVAVCMLRQSVLSGLAAHRCWRVSGRWVTCVANGVQGIGENRYPLMGSTFSHRQGYWCCLCMVLAVLWNHQQFGANAVVTILYTVLA